MLLILALLGCATWSDGCDDGDLVGRALGGAECDCGAEYNPDPGPSSSSVYDDGYDTCFASGYDAGWQAAGCP